jgi:hypothetical protein
MGAGKVWFASRCSIKMGRIKMETGWINVVAILAKKRIGPLRNFLSPAAKPKARSLPFKVDK